MATLKLLNPQDPDPVRKIPANDRNSAFVLVGDHAGAAIPAALGNLGLSSEDRARHIAVDIGTQALGEALAQRLGAPFLSQAYSRLVIDCNRDPAHRGSIVIESDGTPVPGNRDMNSESSEARCAEILEPYQRAVADELREREGHDPILVSLHSFTPKLGGVRRPWDIGVLHDGRRDDFAKAVLAKLKARGDLRVGDNQPYRMDATDYTVPRHAFAAGLRYAELEVRQDLLGGPDDIDRMATAIAEALTEPLRGDAYER